MTTPENRITDICIISKPVYYQPSGQETSIEVYRSGTVAPVGKYRCYKNPTAASLRRVKRFIPQATQRMTRYELGEYYIDLRFR